jgi:hypothetical protein
MAATGTKTSLLIFVNKSTGEDRQIEISFDEAYYNALIEKADRVNAHIKAGTFPDRVEYGEDCEKCPFKTICNPEITFSGAEVIFDAELEAEFTRRAEIKAIADEYKELDETIKTKLKKSLADGTAGEKKSLLVGDRFTVAASWTMKKGYEVKPSNYWTLSIKEPK